MTSVKERMKLFQQQQENTSPIQPPIRPAGGVKTFSKSPSMTETTTTTTEKTVPRFPIRAGSDTGLNNNSNNGNNNTNNTNNTYNNNNTNNANNTNNNNTPTANNNKNNDELTSTPIKNEKPSIAITRSESIDTSVDLSSPSSAPQAPNSAGRVSIKDLQKNLFQAGFKPALQMSPTNRPISSGVSGVSKSPRLFPSGESVDLESPASSPSSTESSAPRKSVKDLAGDLAKVGIGGFGAPRPAPIVNADPSGEQQSIIEEFPSNNQTDLDQPFLVTPSSAQRRVTGARDRQLPTPKKMLLEDDDDDDLLVTK